MPNYIKTSGSKIIPLSQDDAIEWLERYNETDVLEHYFPDHIQDA